MISISKRLVGLSGGLSGSSLGFLFESLARLFPVDFRVVDGRLHEPLDALIVLDGNASNGYAAAEKGLPALVMMKDGECQLNGGEQTVRFGRAPHLETCLRHQVMTESQDTGGCSIPCGAGDQILASTTTGAVWVSRPRGSGLCQLAGVPLPSLSKGEYLFEYLNRRRFMQLLPLMHFLRQVVKEHSKRSVTVIWTPDHSLCDQATSNRDKR